MRRSALAKIALSVLLLLGLLVISPFILSLQPSAEKNPNKLTVLLSLIPIDSFAEIEWNNQPVIIFRPGLKTIEGLVGLKGHAFPPALKNGFLPPAFMYVRISTVHGCGLNHAQAGTLGSFWPGGWFDPCHHGAWDYSGRWIAGINGGDNKLANLATPTYQYTLGTQGVEFYRSF